MKTGLVLEGGALRTIFSIGACDALLDGDLMPDYVVGVSAGIAYGVSYISRQKRRNLHILTNYANDKRYMGPKNLLEPDNRCYFGRSNYIPGCFLLWCGSCRRSRPCICHPPQCIQSNAGICVMVCIVFLTPHCGSSYFHRFSFRSCSCIFYQPHASVKEKGNPDNDGHCCHIKHYLLSFYRFMEPYTHF